MPLARALTSADDAVTRQAVSVARAVPAGKGGSATLENALLRVARDQGRPAEVRVDALSARPAGSTVEAGPLCAAPDQPRARAAGAASHRCCRRSPEGRTGSDISSSRWRRSLETAGPLELVRLLPAFEKSTDEEVGLAMIAALDRSTARSTVRADILRATLAKYPPSVQRAGEVLLTSVNVDATRQAARLDELLSAAQNGDVARGQTVFNSTKAACLSCHAIGYIGGRVGPDLTRVGQVRSERDLLEAVVFPNASFARGFEAVDRADAHRCDARRRPAERCARRSRAGHRLRVPTCVFRDRTSPRSSPARSRSCRRATVSCSRARSWQICSRS